MHNSLCQRSRTQLNCCHWDVSPQAHSRAAHGGSHAHRDGSASSAQSSQGAQRSVGPIQSSLGPEAQQLSAAPRGNAPQHCPIGGWVPDPVANTEGNPSSLHSQLHGAQHMAALQRFAIKKKSYVTVPFKQFSFRKKLKRPNSFEK